MCLFPACSDDDDPAPQGPTFREVTLTFEECQFAEGKKNNVVSGQETTYTEQGCQFVHKEVYGMYGGAVISSESDKSDWQSDFPGTPGALSVIGNKEPQFAGAGQSEKFAIFWFDPYADLKDFHPSFGFEGQETHPIISARINNAAQVWQCMKIGYYSNPAFKEGDFYEVVFTGYDAAGTPGKSVTFALGDFRDGKSFLCEEWTEVDLSELGEVNKVEITYRASEAFANMMYDKFALCLDNILFHFPLEESAQ